MSGERSPAIKAATVANKLKGFDADERRELDTFPESIRAKYEKKRAELAEKTEPKILKMAEALYEAERGDPGA